ncbi:30757_t:CDS:1, partial [Racocetra persica]
EYKVMCPYLGVEVKCEMRTCQGSKLCKFATSEFYNDLVLQITQKILSNNIDNNTF